MKIFLVLISVRGLEFGRKDYINEKFQGYNRESNPRPSGLCLNQLHHCVSLLTNESVLKLLLEYLSFYRRLPILTEALSLSLDL